MVDLFKWVTKKDLFYWFSFVVVCSLLSSDIGQTDKLILDNWSFASVIVSIILAVLAIIYTYEQSSTTLFSTRKLEESAGKVERVSTNLEKISVNDLFTNLEDKISELTQSVEESIENKLSTHYDDLKVLIGQNAEIESPFETNEDLFTREQWREYVERYIVDNSTIAGVVIVHLYIKYKFKLTYGYEEMAMWIENNSKLEKGIYQDGVWRGTMNGITIVLQTFNIVGITIDGNNLTVDSFSKDLGLEIESILENNQESMFIKKIRKFIEEKK